MLKKEREFARVRRSAPKPMPRCVYMSPRKVTSAERPRVWKYPSVKRKPFWPEPENVGVRKPDARSRGLMETEAYGSQKTGTCLTRKRGFLTLTRSASVIVARAALKLHFGTSSSPQAVISPLM